MSIVFEIGGRKINLARVTDPFSASVLNGWQSIIEEKAKVLSSSERQQITITVKGKDVEHLSVTCSGPDEIISKLRGILGD